jgi:hypothetical protein
MGTIQGLLRVWDLALTLKGIEIDIIAFGELPCRLLAPGHQYVLDKPDLVGVTHPCVVHGRLLVPVWDING